MTTLDPANVMADQANATGLEGIRARDAALLPNWTVSVRQQRDAQTDRRTLLAEVDRLAADLAEAQQRVQAIEAVHCAYFDQDVSPTDPYAGPEPEDVWRYDRDFRAALAGAIL